MFYELVSSAMLKASKSATPPKLNIKKKKEEWSVPQLI